MLDNAEVRPILLAGRPHPLGVEVGGEVVVEVLGGRGALGIGRRVSFRMLHVWDFKDDAISREQVWLDGGSIAAQLTSPQHGGLAAETASA